MKILAVAVQLNAGFLGGLVAGFLAGYIVLLIKKYIKLPKSLQGIMPVLVIPVLGSLSVGLILFYIIGKAAIVLGVGFITEGAIPFAAGDPLRVIPSIMVGSAVTGALSMAFKATLSVPHGGIFVFFAE